ncbi:hypothetical protein TpMuguga_01g00357 [Theileria parva strain Muguga]|uniref:Mediator of RNA polymerase II transcription subunit 21 n=1 Tax=Theileria parva TaxID=5875 RepID=Q4N8V7_THEPA|nr:uncharacterized protein TpMuguga_01g00357 [Theileria parva strain Muguga]EAN33601.1 hypothetical protein TpMuguga_01g00357 [Theileria parva strain Muguga]|eukprot:XP_765884.1 hypothetical protein [Theileria parva strain Muguga]
MSYFISPVAQETITKLQYLLQNTLYTYAEIVSTLDQESSKELNEELSNVGIKSQVSDPDSNVTTDKNMDSKSINMEEFIAERVERLGVLNDQIQAHVDLLPDSSITREQIESTISILDTECVKTANELELLYAEYDKIYNKLKDAINLKHS